MKPQEPAGGRTSLRVRRPQSMLRDQVLEGLRGAILRGEFRPGQRLIERTLCDLFGVSRTSVREALRRLESEGLVKSAPGMGPTVSLLTVQEAEHIHEVRAVLTGLAARLFAQRRTDRQTAQLRLALAKLERAAAQDDPRKTVEASVRFYADLIEGSGNPTVVQILLSLNARVMFLRTTEEPPPGRFRECLDELAAIVDAVAGGQPDLAHDLAVEHVRRGGGAALLAVKPKPAQTAT